MRRAKGRQRGVTIIELMVAAVCLGFIAAPVLGCLSMMRQNVAEAKTQAYVLAILRNDLATNATYNSLALLVSGTSTYTVALQNGVVVTVNRSYAAVSGYQNLYRLTATATWSGGYSGYRSDTATLETYNVTSS